MKNVIFVNNINFKEIRAFKAHEVFLFVLHFCLSASGEGYLQMAY